MSKGTGIGMKLYYFKYPYRIEIVSGMGMRPSTGIGMRQCTGMGMRHVHSVGGQPQMYRSRGDKRPHHMRAQPSSLLLGIKNCSKSSWLNVSSPVLVYGRISS